MNKFGFFYVLLSLIKYPVLLRSFFFHLDLANYALEIHSLFGILIQQVLRKVIKGTQGPVYKRLNLLGKLALKKALLDGWKDREECQVCLGMNSESLPSPQ